MLTGRTAGHVALVEGKIAIHREAVEAYRSLRAAAAASGIDLRIASGFRDFAAQLRLWNAKALGERPLLGAGGEPLERAGLSDEDTVFAILRWSALPGASRHHWGSEIDVFDAEALAPGERLHLVPQEAAPGGRFERLGRWLEGNLGSTPFFRPYREDRGGVGPEWWHLSYRPVAERWLAGLSPQVLELAVARADLQLKDVVLAKLPEIYRRFVVNISDWRREASAGLTRAAPRPRSSPAATGRACRQPPDPP